MSAARRNDPMTTGSYGTVGESLEVIQKSHKAWFMNPVAVCIIAMMFSGLDAATLFTQFDTAMNYAMIIIAIVTVGVCMAENFVPMLAAVLFHQCFTLRHRERRFKVLFCLVVAALIVLLGVLMYMRWATRSAAIDTSVSGLGGAAAGYAPEQSDSSCRDSLAIVLGVVPWVTSMVTFVLTYLVDNPLEKRRNAVQTAILEIKERIIDVNALLAEVEAHDLDKMECLVREDGRAANYALDKLADGWNEATARKLMEKRKTAQAISRLSESTGSAFADTLPEPMSGIPAMELHPLPDSRLDTAG